MKSETITHEKNDSILIKPLAKGGYTWEIKLYFDDSETKAEFVVDRLKIIDDKIKKSFS